MQTPSLFLRHFVCTLALAGAVLMPATPALAKDTKDAAKPAETMAQKVPGRIVSIGGTITEIIYALGAEKTVVAVDTTSTYPERAQELPDVGYMRRLSSEGVLSVNPDMIIATEGSGPKDVLDVLKKASVPTIIVPEGFDNKAITRKIAIIGKTLGKEAEAKVMIEKLTAELERVDKLTARITSKKRVMFVLSQMGGRIFAAGKNTSAQAIIERAGGINALEGLEGFKPVTREAVLAANPDVILAIQRGGSHGVTAEELFAKPPFSQTPAAKNKALVKMNGLLLLGFGPRTPAAITRLAKALYPEQFQGQ